MSDRSRASVASAHDAASAALVAVPAIPGAVSHALPSAAPNAPLLERAANPLGVLALFEQATTGLAPKLVAGGLSCMLISAILNPMDVIKVRLQTQSSVGVGGVRKYTSFLGTASTILREEGYRRGLMRGFTASMLREASYSSLRMGLYDCIKILLAPQGTARDDFTLLHKIAAGCTSGAIGSFLAVPTDLVKIRFQNYSPERPNPYRHSFQALGDIYHRGGVRGLYAGATPTVVRAGILTGAQLASYDHSKRLMLRSGYFTDAPSTHLLASIFAGLVTTTAVNPADMIKTRIMADANKVLYRNPLDCLLKTLRHEGPRALAKGWIPNYLRLGPHFLVSLPLAEFIRVRLGADSM